MTKEVKNQHKGKKILLGSIGILAALMAICIIALSVYTSDYYRSEVGIEDFAENIAYKIEETSTGILVDGKGSEDAIIFYPGAKVEYTAYLPLCVKLAEQGVDCFLVEMPIHLAIFGMNKAGKIMDAYEYENWYLSGHSLGGAMAAAYAAEHPCI